MIGILLVFNFLIRCRALRLECNGHTCRHCTLKPGDVALSKTFQGWIAPPSYIIFRGREQHVSAQNGHRLSQQLYVAKQSSEVLNLRRTRTTWQTHVRNSSNPQSPLPVLFRAILKLPAPFLLPPSLSVFPSLPLSLCSPPPHPSLSRTTGACLLSSQCFYSLALAQGSIQSGHCIHSASPIIHMLT